MPRILHLRSPGGLLGAERVVGALAANATSRGVPSGVAVTLDDENATEAVIDHYRALGLTIHPLRFGHPYDPRPLRQLRKLIRANGYELIHAHGYRENLYALLAAQGRARVTTTHNQRHSLPTRRLRIYTALDAQMKRLFDAVVGVSAPILEELTASGLPRSVLHYVPNGIEVANYASSDVMTARTRVRRKLNLDSEAIVVISVGRLTPEKNHQAIIAAIDALRHTYPRLRLVIVGDGPLREPLEAQARSIERPGLVTFTGTRRDIADLLHASDVFVLPSRTEGLPISLLEAMRCSLPVVATRVGDVEEVVGEGAGLIVAPGHDDQLVDALSRLAGDPRLRAAMGASGQARVREHYSLTRMTSRYLAIYAAVLARRSAHSGGSRV